LLTQDAKAAEKISSFVAFALVFLCGLAALREISFWFYPASGTCVHHLSYMDKQFVFFALIRARTGLVCIQAGANFGFIPAKEPEMPNDYQRIAAAIRFLQNKSLEQPSLDQAAREVGLSPYHFQRLFRRFAGVSPKRFLQHLTSEQAKKHLKQSASVLETSLAVGLSGPGRLHDLMINVEAVTPGDIKSGGEGLEISYGRHPTPFGDCGIAMTPRGICRLEFHDEEGPEAFLDSLRQDWPRAQIKENLQATQALIEKIFFPEYSAGHSSILLLLRGTNFQLRVWQALLAIPPGCVTSYGAIAGQIEQPGASRAVGSAIGSNPISYLIPCHRVLRNDGGIGGYRWSVERKQAILGRELSRLEAADPSVLI
jgi:AraC family transcriptional regulator of adaptative response/methylated-DNA-[protein]-cysteine methyltransferase